MSANPNTTPEPNPARRAAEDLGSVPEPWDELLARTTAAKKAPDLVDAAGGNDGGNDGGGKRGAGNGNDDDDQGDDDSTGREPDALDEMLAGLEGEAIDHQWRPVSVLSRIDEVDADPEPAPLWTRSDGATGLLYRGATHLIQSGPGLGKSMVALVAVLNVVREGGRALFLEMGESPYRTTGRRLLQLGATPDELALVDWVGPDTAPTGIHRADFAALCEGDWDLIVIDSVSMGLDIWQAPANDNDAVTAWFRAFPERLARDTGAAVLMLDHVGHNTTNRGPRGASSKLDRVTGAQYILSVPGVGFMPGTRAAVVLRVDKDRHGTVKGHATPTPGQGKHPVAAVVWVDTTDPTAPSFSTDPHGAGAGAALAGFRPTKAMELVSRELEGADDRGMTIEPIRHAVGMKQQTVRDALAVLVAEGYAIELPKRGSARPHATRRPYREADDPAVNHGQTPIAEGWGQ